MSGPAAAHCLAAQDQLKAARFPCMKELTAAASNLCGVMLNRKPHRQGSGYLYCGTCKKPTADNQGVKVSYKCHAVEGVSQKYWQVTGITTVHKCTEGSHALRVLEVAQTQVAKARDTVARMTVDDAGEWTAVAGAPLHVVSVVARMKRAREIAARIETIGSEPRSDGEDSAGRRVAARIQSASLLSATFSALTSICNAAELAAGEHRVFERIQSASHLAEFVPPLVPPPPQ